MKNWKFIENLKDNIEKLQFNDEQKDFVFRLYWELHRCIYEHYLLVDAFEFYRNDYEKTNISSVKDKDGNTADLFFKKMVSLRAYAFREFYKSDKDSIIKAIEYFSTQKFPKDIPDFSEFDNIAKDYLTGEKYLQSLVKFYSRFKQRLLNMEKSE